MFMSHKIEITNHQPPPPKKNSNYLLRILVPTSAYSHSLPLTTMRSKNCVKHFSLSELSVWTHSVTSSIVLTKIHIVLVMAAPEKYPLTHDSKQVAQPPSYEVVVNQIPGQEEQQRSEPTNEISREIEGVELTHETRDETNENEDDHLNNTERESDISDGGDDVAEVEENETSSDIRRSSSLIDDRHPDSQRRSCDEGCCENTASGVQPMNDSEVDVGADGDANEENDLEVVVASCKLDIAQSDVDASCKLDIAQSDVDDTKKESEITTSPNYPHVITTDV